MLNLEQLQRSVAAAKHRFALIRKKYPELKAFLVLSSPHGQTDIDSSPLKILNEFPAMIVNDHAKTTALQLRSRLESEIMIGSEAERITAQLNQLAGHFHYDGQCQIETRFHELNYDLIWRLQKDDLIDRRLTPQTKASIRIVLGSLEYLQE